MSHVSRHRGACSSLCVCTDTSACARHRPRTGQHLNNSTSECLDLASSGTPPPLSCPVGRVCQAERHELDDSQRRFVCNRCSASAGSDGLTGGTREPGPSVCPPAVSYEVPTYAEACCRPICHDPHHCCPAAHQSLLERQDALASPFVRSFVHSLIRYFLYSSRSRFLHSLAHSATTTRQPCRLCLSLSSMLPLADETLSQPSYSLYPFSRCAQDAITCATRRSRHSLAAARFRAPYHACCPGHPDRRAGCHRQTNIQDQHKARIGTTRDNLPSCLGSTPRVSLFARDGGQRMLPTHREETVHWLHALSPPLPLRHFTAHKLQKKQKKKKKPIDMPVIGTMVWRSSCSQRMPVLPSSCGGCTG